MSAARVFISGGGTAGHLYPALALGRKLKEREPETEITYIGSSRALEKRIMQHHKVDFIPLRIEGLKGRGWKTLRALFLLPRAFWQSYRLLRRLRPGLVIGVGGYSAGPVVLLASRMKIPTLILEQNRHPGFTNRRLLPYVDKAVAAFESSLPDFKGKGVFLGNPVREEFYSLTRKERENRLTVLIFGGSQGSHFLNQRVVDSLPLLQAFKDWLRIFHQTGENDRAWVAENYGRQGFADAVVEAYFFDMPALFQETDLVVSRAGASTIAELIAARKASLLVPFARATDDHQALNARELEQVEGAVVLKETDFTPEALAREVGAFIENEMDRITRMERNLSRLQTPPGVTDRIADLCLDLMQRRR
jgi:UDP-N-acetylglucosamine--N-acetylmuramyl-(pentapeptide) pyrophosphoryl-undecaprenol N-acetylglucosamine transferase